MAPGSNGATVGESRGVDADGSSTGADAGTGGRGTGGLGDGGQQRRGGFSFFSRSRPEARASGGGRSAPARAGRSDRHSNKRPAAAGAQQESNGGAKKRVRFEGGHGRTAGSPGTDRGDVNTESSDSGGDAEEEELFGHDSDAGDDEPRFEQAEEAAPDAVDGNGDADEGPPVYKTESLKCMHIPFEPPETEEERAQYNDDQYDENANGGEGEDWDDAASHITSASRVGPSEFDPRCEERELRRLQLNGGTFCFLCFCRANEKSYRANPDVRRLIEIFNSGYMTTKPSVLCSQVQDFYNEVLRRNIPFQSLRRQWTMRTIWEHFTEHSPTNGVMLMCNIRAINEVMRNLERNGLKVVNQSTGSEHTEKGAVAMYKDLIGARTPLLNALKKCA